MATPTILSLPTELLDKIYSYLDWNRSKSLRPHRPDVISISLTCHHLRETILPLIFQNVTLQLRWVAGALIEPALFRLRRDHPHLVKHVRSVFVQTQFGQLPDPQWKLPDFTVPDELSAWLRVSVDTEDDGNVEDLHRQRVNSLARIFLEKYHSSELLNDCPLNERRYLNKLVRQLLDDDSITMVQTSQNKILSDTSITTEAQRGIGETSNLDAQHRIADIVATTPGTRAQRTDYRNARLELDALVVVALCLPATVTSLSFESLHDLGSNITQNNFALNVAAMAFKTFGDRLRRVTMITSPERLSDTITDPTDAELAAIESSIITEEVLGELTRINALSLSDFAGGYGNPRMREFDSRDQVQWHSLSTSVTQLELHNMSSEPSELIHLITGFSHLNVLLLNNIVLNPQDFRRGQMRNHLLWLAFFIELRRQMIDLKLELGELKCWDERLQMSIVPKSALLWFEREAVPSGNVVGFDRETRLTEDYESFWHLWHAEDSESGEQAREERKDGKLVDAAMASRWRTL